MARDFGNPERQDADSEMRVLLAEVIRRCPKKRAQIAEEMTCLAGQRITEFMLNDYSAAGKRQNRLPAIFVKPFCQVVEDDRLARLLLPARLRSLLAMAEHMVAAADSERQMQVLQEEILREKGARDRGSASPR